MMKKNAKEKKKRKRVFCHFDYRECDAFAAYLREMSLKGWHFVKWNAGLIFEQGQPEDIVYAVEIFSKGSEMDTKPETETEEFAEYCEAAGWKLIDSCRKFCIFRRERSSAVPIVTEEERFQNIWKAELRKWLGDYAARGSVALIFCLGYFLWVPLQNWIFHNLIVVCILLFLLPIVIGAGRGIDLFFWKQKKKRALQMGKTVRYEKRKWKWMTGDTWNWLTILLLFILAWQEGYINVVIISGIVVAACLLFAVGIALLRPSREDNWMIQMGGGTLMGLVLIVILSVSLLTDRLPDNPVLEVDPIPLVQADYKQVEGEITYQDTMQMNGILGSSINCTIYYESDGLVYRVFESRSNWILKRIWQQVKDDFDEVRDCTDEWGAVSAVEWKHRGSYLVRYPDKVLTLWCGETLEKEQIQVIAEKLDLMNRKGR